MNAANLDPATSFVRSLDGNFYMVREAAEILGINHRMLRNLNESGDENLKPSYVAYLGKVKIYLYTEEDLDKIREYLKTRKQVFPNDNASGPANAQKNGRPAKFSKEDRKERQKLYSKAHYYGKRAKEEEELGNTDKAQQYLDRQRQVKEELDQWPTTASPSESPTKHPSTETEPGSSSSTAPTFTSAKQSPV